MSDFFVKAAVVQAAPIVFDTPRTLKKLVDLTGAADSQGADIVVFPEAFVAAIQRASTSVLASACVAPKGATIFSDISRAQSTCPAQTAS
jgi:nitrilase